MNKMSLAELDLLRDTRHDIRTQPWAQPLRREARVLYFGIKRAKEEIRHLNVEIRRLLTYMHDKHVDYYRAIAAHIIIDPPLAVELATHWRHACRISTSISQRIVAASQLVGFSGSLFPGVREGRDSEVGSHVPPPGWLHNVLGIVQSVLEYEEPDDEDGLAIRELQVDEDNLAEFMNHLSTFDDQ
jgi:hypothetical protein